MRRTRGRARNRSYVDRARAMDGARARAEGSRWGAAHQRDAEEGVGRLSGLPVHDDQSPVLSLLARARDGWWCEDPDPSAILPDAASQ